MQAKMEKNNRLIVFFIPPEKIINGGILSIFSICQTSRKFKNIHGADVVLSTYPGTKSYKKNDLFKNDEIIYSFDEVVKRGMSQFLQLHVPEYASLEVFLGLKKYSDYLRAIPDLNVNIMTQNIWLLQKPNEVAKWFLLTPNVTQTVAHDKSATQELADQYYLPSHLLSVFNDPSQYKWVPYEKKDNLIVLSPDETAKKKLIVNKLKKQFPAYEIVTIKNMHYEEYKGLVCRAKFTVTFGEGFDGYYIETFFSGGITLAVYNDDFFPDKDFSKFGNTYHSYDEMLRNITKNMTDLENNKSRYESIVDENLKKITKLYDFSAYAKNLENFYRHKFTYHPSKDSAKRLIASILTEIEEKDATIAERNKAIAEQGAAIAKRDRSIQEQGAAIAERDKIIAAILNSRSWKVTKPLRQLSSIFSKGRGSG